MHPQESHRLKPGTPVWIWIVRLAKGRWWPGVVESLRTFDNQLRIAVKFECLPRNGRDKAPVIVGVTTTAIRYLEPRDIDNNGIDQPRHSPVSLLERPEEVEASDPQANAPSTCRSPKKNEETAEFGLTSHRTNHRRGRN